jgi:2,4'-dihydroxyacetophenone dioxygenase
MSEQRSMTTADTSRMPYQLPFPAEAADEVLVSPAVPEYERLWVPQAEGLDFRPLLLHTRQGYWCNLLRVRRTGMVSRHRHPQPVTGYVIKGRWHYLEHDWVAEPGAFLFEPPGETHTLVVPEGETEMITMFTVNGVMVYVDPWGETTGFEDVFTKIDMCRRHYAEVGLGADYVDQFIR